MPPKKRFITCEICGDRASRRGSEKRIFMAKFPGDEARCRQWVKFVGKEDLIYVPIEKLRTLKYVCGNHFEDRAFNKKKNRLKKSAVPLKNLNADPLPDEMLLEFPYHINSNIDVKTVNVSEKKIDNEAILSQIEAIDNSGSNMPRQQLVAEGLSVKKNLQSQKRKRSPSSGGVTSSSSQSLCIVMCMDAPKSIYQWCESLNDEAEKAATKPLFLFSDFLFSNQQFFPKCPCLLQI